ncbi:GDSL-type esterase/lipase family protein [Weissella cibaria]|uniref:GDSL-type esterase/lipase family protein n=1 Tax=Weissella cibaria TaxID=137591 RepID=UPI0013E8C1CF|nr:GDSL-type esterase/lipase family protein [Weissella cibaria]MDK9677023.1 GDSL-type esterase/lipase family protein [Weissella cibaria]
MSKTTARLMLASAVLGFGLWATAGSTHAATVVQQPKESAQTTAKVEGVKRTATNATTQPVETPEQSENNYFNYQNVWVVGDSLAVGWDGNQVVKQNYPTLLANIIKPESMHAGYASSGSQISGNQNGPGDKTYDLTNNLKRVTADPQFKNAESLVLEIGVNDLNYSDNSLGYVQQRLQKNIRTMRAANPKLVIYGVLPIPSYMGGNNLNVKGQAGYTFNQLADALKQVYTSFGIPVLDWRQAGYQVVTDANRQQTLGDHEVHPTQDTYAKMADLMAQWMIEVSTADNSNLAENEHDSKTNFISNGWQTDESGNREYATNSVLASGFKNINGQGYFFNPSNNGLLKGKNQLATAGGKTYYVATDGTTQEGIKLVNGKWYDFGSNKTYYARNFTQSGYLNTDQGWRWFENGKPYTGFRLYYGAYYYFINGVRQENKWVSQWGNRYYVGSDGRSVQGYHLIDGIAYDFGNNGTFFLRGKLSGYQDAGNGWLWYENGEVFTGFRFYMGTYYWFEKGARINNQWRTAWNLKYYVDSEGRAVQGDGYNVDGTYYNFSHDGTFFLRGKASGYVSTPDGWLWIENGKRYTGFRMYMGAYYYFINGVRQHNQWVSEWGLKYYVGNDGRSVEGNKVKIDGKTYNFGTNHTFFLR